MFADRLKFVALAAVLAVGLTGLSLHRWASASDEPGSPPAVPAAAPQDARPGVTPRRREAVIRVPAGTFVKEVDVPPYGSGRLTWTYQDERIVGLIEGSVLGFEFELATEAEYALSSTGTIYGVITSARLNHLKLPAGEEYEKLKPFVGLWSAIEPLFSEVITDLPFSYRFRVQDDRLVISNFRILLAGPNPLGKAGGLLMQKNDNALIVLAYFQALGTALEGTYTAPDAREKANPGKRPLFHKPMNR